MLLAAPKRNFRRRSLVMAFAALVIVFILWNIPQFTPLVYPFRLFVTFIHEAGHGLAAIVTGGQFDHFVVYGDGSGIATTRGGSLLLILPAGYLGAALFGSVLFYLIHTLPHSRLVSGALGAWLIGLSVLFTGLDSIALFVGVLSGVGLLLLAWKANSVVNTLVLNVLAMMTALNAVFDLVILTRYSHSTLGNLRNDAAAFAETYTPLLPAAVWALVWAALAVLMLGTAVYLSIIRPMRKS